MKRSTYIKPDETVKVSKALMIALAKDLQELHDLQVYNVYYWPAAKEVISQFYERPVD